MADEASMTAFYLNDYSRCTVYSAVRMLSKKCLLGKALLPMRFWHNSDSERDLEETVSEDHVEEDTDFEEFSSDENESVDPPVVSQPPAETVPSNDMVPFPTPKTG